MAHSLLFWAFTFKGARSDWRGMCYHCASFTELGLGFLVKQFFLRIPMAGDQVTVLLLGLRGKRSWEKFALPGHWYLWLAWTELTCHRSCFKCVHSLEGNWRRPQNLYDLTKLSLTFGCRLFSFLWILDQWTRSELLLLMQQIRNMVACFKGPWEINVNVVSCLLNVSNKSLKSLVVSECKWMDDGMEKIQESTEKSSVLVQEGTVVLCLSSYQRFKFKKLATFIVHGENYSSVIYQPDNVSRSMNTGYEAALWGVSFQLKCRPQLLF